MKKILLVLAFSGVISADLCVKQSTNRYIHMTSKDVLVKVSQEISRATGQPFTGISNSGGGGAGGSGASTFIITDKKSARDYFVKMSNLGGFDMLRTEYEGVKVIYETQTIRVPQPICYGTADYNSFVVFEKLCMGGYGDAVVAGTKLAEMHSHTSPNGKFGWDFTNTCGATVQPNEWCDTWSEFWDTYRLGHILSLAKKAGANFPGTANLNCARNQSFSTNSHINNSVKLEEDQLRTKVKALLEVHDCKPSPVHGDLWAGNIGATKDGEPVIYDPAFYYGDREVDVAMSKLFGSQSKQFYDAYDKARDILVSFNIPVHDLSSQISNFYRYIHPKRVGSNEKQSTIYIIY